MVNGKGDAASLATNSTPVELMGRIFVEVVSVEYLTHCAEDKVLISVVHTANLLLAIVPLKCRILVPPKNLRCA